MEKWMHITEAPANWQRERSRKTTYRTACIGSFASFSLGAICLCSFLIQGSPFFDKLAGALITVGTVGVGLMFSERSLDLSPHSLYVLATVVVGLSASATQYLHLLVADNDVRIRTMVLAHMAWLSMPSLLGMRRKESVIFFVWVYSHLIASCLWGNALHQHHTPVRYFALLLTFYVAHFGAATEQQVFLRELYDAQQRTKKEKEELWNTQQALKKEKDALRKALHQLTVEKEASKALLSMVCDACLWLSTDGDTIVRSDHHWESIVGIANKDSDRDCLSAHVLACERDRLKYALQGGSSAHFLVPSALLQPVRSLPITLLQRGCADVVDVDLFIVDRCIKSGHTSSKSASSDDELQVADALQVPGYLLGIRVRQSEGSASRQGVEARATAPNFAAAAHGRQQETAGNTSNSGLTSPVESESSFSAEPESRQLNLGRLIDTNEAREKRTPPYGERFEASGIYLDHILQSNIGVLVASMNFEVEGCCAFHFALSRLRALSQDVSDGHSCSTPWPVPSDDCWQCSNCTGVMDRSWCHLCEVAFGADPDSTSEAASVGVQKACVLPRAITS